MTHPSLNLGWLFSSSTNIYTHQQSTPSPPPVTLPPVLPLTCIHSRVNFMGRYKKNRGKQSKYDHDLAIFLSMMTQVCILSNSPADFFSGLGSK